MNESPASPRILVIEDSMSLAMLLNEVLTRKGYTVFLAARLARGLEIARSELLAGAVLDINIAGDRVYPVAAELVRRGIPFLFASGYEVADTAFCAYETLHKPYSINRLVDSLSRMIHAPIQQAAVTDPAPEPDAMIAASQPDPC